MKVTLVERKQAGDYHFIKDFKEMTEETIFVQWQRGECSWESKVSRQGERK